MSMRLLTIGASSSRKSINRAFAIWAGQQFDADLDDVDLNDFEMPIYSEDRQAESGIPSLAHDFKSKIKACDGIIVSFAEHNGSYTAAFKNIIDWVSVIDKELWEQKPMLLLSTSPGRRGGKTLLELAVNDFPLRAGRVCAHFALPSFYANFENGIKDQTIRLEFDIAAGALREAIAASASTSY
ncbi:MAG: NADPH-dependent FMN reductase [Crocinitomicaceae bacterium]|nr:NADPH-dependent FMN reductase [Crocinitomicaceae bacterium]|tara:strand:+ start:157 stop:708 length:552 start_codon:yes stop_codon:yes gene_type:complete